MKQLLKKLNLDGLSSWTPQNATVARDLVLAFHDIFALEGNKLGCTIADEHEIHISNSEPFKEQFKCIPPMLMEEVPASLHDMLDAGSYTPANLHGATLWYW